MTGARVAAAAAADNAVSYEKSYLRRERYRWAAGFVSAAAATADNDDVCAGPDRRWCCAHIIIIGRGGRRHNIIIAISVRAARPP